MNDLHNAFHKYFEIVIADTPELLQEVFRIRFQVLCVEQRLPGFDISHYPDGLESDSYDHHSCHILLQHRATGNFMGTVRLIMFDPMDPEKPFPIELHTQFNHELLDMNKLSRRHTAEISRFVILEHYVRRKADRGNPKPMEDSKKVVTERRERRSFPNLGLSFVVGIVRLSAQHDIRNWVSAMDPAMNRLLNYFGADLNPVGPLIDYHGLRRPYFKKITDVLDKMHSKSHDAWEVATNYGKYYHSREKQS
jgi:N-acyl amino acid synthase of PEP-CTERM/exosortase system